MVNHDTQIRGTIGGQFSLEDEYGVCRCVSCGSESGYGMICGKFQRFCPHCDVDLISDEFK